MAIDTDRTPDMRVVFPAGSYKAAMRHYQLASGWLAGNGIAFDETLASVINSPTFNGETPPTVLRDDENNDWLARAEQDGWQVTINLWCDFSSMDEQRRAVIDNLNPPIGAEILRNEK